MTGIIEALQRKSFLCTRHGADEKAISQAEDILGVHFAEDYREYLKTFGVATYQGHELTGISDVVRLSVVETTLQNRACHAEEYQGWYVIENAEIDEVSIWQSPEGKVYQSSMNMQPRFICSTFSEYITRY